MRILSVELENIKSYEKGRVEFTDGVNAIVGRNGAGKSTILEAVGFALFSSVAYDVPYFLREGARDGTITVAFESDLDGRIYQSVRRVGGAAKQFIYDAELGVNLAEGRADVGRFLRMHLGLQPGADLALVFRDAVGVPQGTLTAVFLEKPTQRKNVFDPLLQVDEYKKGFEKLLESKNLLNERSHEISNTIAHFEGKLAALPEMEQRAESTAHDLEANKTALAAARTALESTRAELSALEAQRTAKGVAEQARDHARTAHATAQAAEQLAQLQLDEAQTARTLVAQNQPGHDCYLEALRTKQGLDQKLHALHQVQLDVSTAESAKALAAHELAQARDRLTHIAEAEAQMAALQPAVVQQAEFESQRMEALARQGALKGAKAALERAESTLTHEQASLTKLQAGLARAPAAERELARLKSDLAALAVRIAKSDEERNQNTAEGIAYRDQSEKLAQVQGATCPVCGEPLTPEHRAELIERNEKLRAELREKWRTLNAAAAALGAQRDELESARQAQEIELHSLPSATAVAEQEARAVQAHTQWENARAHCEELAGAPQALAAIEKSLLELGNPAAQMAVARATAQTRAATESAQTRATAALAEAQAQVSALAARLAGFAGLDAEIERAEREQRENLSAYQTVLTHQLSAGQVDARTSAAAAASIERTRTATLLSAAEAEAIAAAQAFDAAAYTRFQEASARLHGDVGSLSSTVSMLTQEAKNLEKQIAALRVEQKNLAEAKVRRDWLRHQTEVLTKLRDAVGKAGPFVTAHMIHRVSVTAAQIYGELTGDFAPRLNWGEDYAISLEVNGRQRAFQSLSGGEQMVAAVAVRLALLNTIAGISVAFFDEPTAHLDSQRREALAGQILSYKGLRQLVVISHDDTFEHATDNVIHLARVNGVSCVLDRESSPLED